MFRGSRLSVEGKAAPNSGAQEDSRMDVPCATEDNWYMIQGMQAQL